MTHKIIRIERDTNKPGMWKARTSENKAVNVFDNQLGLFHDYPELSAMQPGAVLHWRSFPVTVETYQKNGYENVSLVLSRPTGACPDPALQPDAALSRSRAARWAQVVTHPRLRIVSWDLETTGVDPSMDEPISIGIVGHDGETLLDTLIMPTNAGNLTATNAESVHGISAAMLEGAPTFPDVYEKIRALLDMRFWLGYNLKFDSDMLTNACLRHGLEPFVSFGMHDAMPYISEWVGRWDAESGRYPYLKLTEAAELFGLVDMEAHHAAGDALATLEIVKRMSEGKVLL